MSRWWWEAVCQLNKHHILQEGPCDSKNKRSLLFTLLAFILTFFLCFIVNSLNWHHSRCCWDLLFLRTEAKRYGLCAVRSLLFNANKKKNLGIDSKFVTFFFNLLDILKERRKTKFYLMPSLTFLPAHKKVPLCSWPFCPCKHRAKFFIIL